MKIKILFASLALVFATSIAEAQKLECIKQDDRTFNCTELTLSVQPVVSPKEQEFPVGVFMGGMVGGVIATLFVFGLFNFLNNIDGTGYSRRSSGC